MTRALAVALLLASAASAWAAPVTYHCPKRVTFEATYTPDRAQVTLDGQRWTLARVRAAGGAEYLSRADGVRLVTSRRDALLKVGARELSCELYIKP